MVTAATRPRGLVRGGASADANLYQGMGASWTDNPRIPVIAVHEEGTQIAVLVDDGGKVEGAVITQDDGRGMTVWLGADGLPERANSEGYTVLFSDYTDSTLSAAVVHPSGTTEYYPDVPVDRGALQALVALVAQKPVAIKDDSKEFWFLVKTGLLALGVAGCVSAVILSSGAAIAAVAMPCGKAIISIG